MQTDGEALPLLSSFRGRPAGLRARRGGPRLMNVEVDVRHDVFPPEARAYAVSRLLRDERLAAADRAHVILDVEHGRTRAEIVLKLRRGMTVVADALEKDFRTAIDRLADKAGRQVRRLHDRLHDRRFGGDSQKGS